MNVFILCTGRSGSLTFARACEHIRNFTVGHESRARKLGEERLDYPDMHIEADNRLSWFLGALDQRYGNEALYVHLVRNREATVASYNRRWVRYGSLIKAWCEGINQITLHKLDDKSRIRVVEDFYDRVNENIGLFLKDKERVIRIDLEKAAEKFPEFWKEIGAEGDLEKAIQVFDKHHNAGKRAKFKIWKHEFKFSMMQFRRKLFH